MIAGMYVVRDETPTQVARTVGAGSAPGLPGFVIYALRKLGEVTEFRVKNPLADEVPMLPSCTSCEAADGWACPGGPTPENGWTQDDVWVVEMLARAADVPNVDRGTCDPFGRPNR